MKILGTGLSGLVGSRVVELLSPPWSFENLSLETGIDITDKTLVTRYIEQSESQWVFHFAAITDVDGCEQEKDRGQQSRSWQVNVAATEHIVQACKETGKRMVYISTDFVFDGTKPSYTEEDIPNPLSWYALTKYEGEKRVTALGDRGLIVRIAYPYRATAAGKPDFVHRILERLQQGSPVTAPSDSFITPTFIDDIAYALKKLISARSSGIYHVVGGAATTPFEAAQTIARVFELDSSHITSIMHEDYYKNRARRPFYGILKHDKIAKFGVAMSTLEDGLRAVREQVGKARKDV